MNAHRIKKKPSMIGHNRRMPFCWKGGTQGLIFGPRSSSPVIFHGILGRMGPSFKVIGPQQLGFFDVRKLVVMTMGDKALIFTFIDFLDRIAIFFEVLFKSLCRWLQDGERDKLGRKVRRS